MTLTSELNQKARAILIQELGAVGYARFIQQYEEGSGNYTQDRQQWLAEENSAKLHEQASQLATAGALPRPPGAKLH